MATPKPVQQASVVSNIFGAISASALLLNVTATRTAHTVEKSFDLLDEALDASARGVRSFEFK